MATARKNSVKVAEVYASELRGIAVILDTLNDLGLPVDGVTLDGGSPFVDCNGEIIGFLKHNGESFVLDTIVP